MDYLEIILTGFFDDNNREHLENYFRRECKKAEKEFYEQMEFYKGCFRVIEEWEQHLKDKVFKRKQELYMMLSGAKDGTIKHSNTETKPVEELNNDLISYCNEELKNEQVNSIGSLFFTVHLHSVTKGRAAYNMPYYEVLQIKNTIVKWVKDIIRNETLPPEQIEPENTQKQPELLSELITHEHSVNIVESVKTQYKNIRGKRLKLLLLALQDLQLIPKERNAQKFHDCCKKEFNWNVASYTAMNDYVFNENTDTVEFTNMKQYIETLIMNN